jgi:methylated-DNA-[protein]-cysteine S-methyltransferase
MIHWTTMESPLGQLTLLGGDGCVSALYMEGQWHRPPADPEAARDGDVLAEPVHQLGEYFAGERQAFDLDIVFRAGTRFQRRVWRELLAIQYGETWSYGELAARIGQPSASRAVGLANGRNPVAIIVPCHRVVGAGGSLTGYGGGIDRKRWLLEFERGRAAVPA